MTALEDTRGTPAATGNTSYASGARVLTVGIASTGIFTFLYLATASHVLGKGAEYSRISICWAVMYVIVSVIYRPIEQLLSRTISDRHARGVSGHILRTPALIQGTFALLFLAVALALHGLIANHLLDHSQGLYWILVVGVVAYAASYFARGWLGGNKRFALYGGLVFLESVSRFLFALAAAVGVFSGQNAIGVGMTVAPFVSLCVIPLAWRRVRVPGPEAIEVVDAGSSGPASAGVEEAATDLSLRHGAGFATAVVAIMLSEQTLMNAGVIVVAAGAGFNLTSGLTGLVFNVLLIVRAPLQLFQALQTTILPHLTGMQARGSSDEFHRAVRTTLLVIGAFAGVVALGLLAIGPQVMHVATGNPEREYGRLGLAVIGAGMGFHLAAGTLNQALLAREWAGQAAGAWLIAAAAFVLFTATDTIANEVTRVEVGYCAAAGLLALLLWGIYRRSSASSAASGAGQRAALAAAASSR